LASTQKLGNDVTTGEARTEIEIVPQLGHWGWIKSVAISPDGNVALSGGDDGLLKLWDLATGLEIRAFNLSGGWVRSVAFSPDGQTAFSGSDWTLKLWDLATGREIHVFEGLPMLETVSEEEKMPLSSLGKLTQNDIRRHFMAQNAEDRSQL
jgi:WD40 repeat protein